LGTSVSFWDITGNLETVIEFLGKYPQLEAEDVRIVTHRVHEIRARVDAAPKSRKWKMRAAVGERVKWYKDVEELLR
jgi:hypothetical protein